MTLLCQYKNIFGKPREGVHSLRIFDLALVDLVLTIIASYFLKDVFKQTFFKTFICLMILGTCLHFLFCVETTITIAIKNLIIL